MDMPRVINSILLKIRLKFWPKRPAIRTQMGETKRAICVLLSAAMARLRLILFFTALVIATECSATLPTKGKIIKPKKALCNTPFGRCGLNGLVNDLGCLLFLTIHHGIKHPYKIDNEQDYGDAVAVFIKRKQGILSRKDGGNPKAHGSNGKVDDGGTGNI